MRSLTINHEKPYVLDQSTQFGGNFDTIERMTSNKIGNHVEANQIELIVYNASQSV